ncbi:hypothetical protein [Agrobacterium rubi]|uniref:ProQ/FinO domain-containing protein n=1 Tax=Agrobacterium rubi TaxID=28099 RepID=A0ABX2IXR8_9HYPH|nr:hypothetical protein [Agrobacterium rubi]NTF35541.1 hypothetical protein [Agrobacterium rubi]
MNVAPATIDKLGKLFPRLASDHDGEVIATARAIIRTLASSGASLHDMAELMRPKETVKEKIVYRDKPAPKKAKKKKPEPEFQPPPDRVKVLWTDVIRWAPYLINDCGLNEREIAFISTVHDWAKTYKTKLTMTHKQADWWGRILIENDIQPGATE